MSGRLVAAAGRYLDRRAERLAQELMPAGTALASGARVSGHRVTRSGFGTRRVDMDIERGGKRIGGMGAKILPTKHVVVTDAAVAPAHRGKGIGTSAMGALTQNASRAKTPGAWFTAAGDGQKLTAPSTGKRGSKATGARAWQHSDARFMRGAPYMRGQFNAATSGLSEAGQAEARRFHRRARVGLAKPKDIGSLSPETRQALGNVPWAGRVKGGQPFLRKTRYAAGGVAAVGVEEKVRRDS